MNEFGRFVWDARGRREWDRLALATAMAERTKEKLSTMRGWIASLEQSDQTDLDFFRLACDVLEVPREEVEGLIAKVEAEEAVELEAWLSVPQPMMMHWPAVPGFYVTKVLKEMTREEAEAFVSGRARTWPGACALAVSRRLTIWYQAGTGLELRRVVRGAIGESGPCAVIAGTRDGFTFVSGGAAGSGGAGAER